VTYKNLLAEVTADLVSLPVALFPRSSEEAVWALLKAAVLGQPLTLLAQPTEGKEAPRHPVAGGAWLDVESMQSQALERPGFQLTLFTSGSSGMPAAVTHTLPSLIRMLKVSPQHRANVWGLAYNPTHIAGVLVILQAFFNSNVLVNLWGASPADVAARIREYGISHLSATSSFYRLLLPLPEAASGVRSTTLGGESASNELLEKLKQSFPQAKVHNVYASTEVGALLISDGDTFTIPDELLDRVAVREGRLWVHRSLLGKTESGNRMESVGDKVENRNWKIKIRNGEAITDGGTVKRSEGSDGATRKVESGLEKLKSRKPKAEMDGPPSQTMARQVKRSTSDAVLCSQVCSSSAQGHPSSSPLHDAPGHDLRSHHFRAPRASSAFNFQFSEWYNTGDVIDWVDQAAGTFRIVARDRDWVNVGGEKVNPLDVERVIEAVPGVAQARVFGRKNSVLGQVLCAEVALRKTESRKQKSEITVKQSDGFTALQSHGLTDESLQLTEAVLRAWLAARLPTHSVPRMIRFVDAIEQTRSGKVKR